MKLLVYIAGALIIIGILALTAVYKSYRCWHPVAPKAKKRKQHIICVGDSITFGAGVIPFQRWKSYPSYLQCFFGKPYQVMNFGMSGRTLLSTGDMPYTKEKNYLKTMEIDDACYILMLGTNDARYKWWNAQRFQIELIQMIEGYLSHGERVVVIKPPKAHPAEDSGEVSFEICDELVYEVGKIIEETANELSVPVIDLYSFTEKHPEWFSDGVHLNAEGNKQVAKYIYQVIKTF